MIRVKHLTKTCESCPAQWEGETDDRRVVYVRYRWGYLSVQVSEPDGNLRGALRNEEVFGIQVGDELDGCMSYESLKDLTGHLVDWPPLAA